MDHNNHHRDRRRDRSLGYWLSLILAAFSLSAYAANEVFLKLRFRSMILHCHLNDFLATVLLLAVTYLLMIIFAPLPVWRSSWVFAAVTAFAAIYWEYVAPLYLKSVSDPLDLIAYGLGFVFFIFVSHKVRHHVTD